MDHRMDHEQMHAKEMKKYKTVMKFDGGADSFKSLIILGIFVAIFILVSGIIFLMTTYGNI